MLNASLGCWSGRPLTSAPMQPEIDLGPVTLQTFGIMFALGVHRRRACWSRGGCRSSASPSTGPTRWSSPRWSAASSARGSTSSIENYDEVSDDLLGNLFSGSGLVWYGGAIGGAIGVLLWARWRRMLNLTLLDICAPGAGDRLRGRADRLPALRRRRLRHALGRPVGDGLPRRHRARPTCRSTRRRSTRRSRWAWSPTPLAAARPLPARAAVRPLPGARRGRALPGRVRPPQRRGRSSGSPRRSS